MLYLLFIDNINLCISKNDKLLLNNITNLQSQFYEKVIDEHYDVGSIHLYVSFVCV